VHEIASFGAARKHAIERRTSRRGDCHARRFFRNTRELRERLALCSPEEAGELIGQFGLGFLSAFLIASEVTLTTRSVTGTPALRWHSAGDEHYDLTPGERAEPGTTINIAGREVIVPTDGNFQLQITADSNGREVIVFAQDPQGNGSQYKLSLGPGNRSKG